MHLLHELFFQALERGAIESQVPVFAIFNIIIYYYNTVDQSQIANLSCPGLYIYIVQNHSSSVSAVNRQGNRSVEKINYCYSHSTHIERRDKESKLFALSYTEKP